MDNGSSSKFTCQKCGGHELVVTHIWNTQVGTDGENWREWGALRMITTGNMSSRKKSRKMEIMKFSEVISASSRKTTTILNRKITK